jgi:hypothetical protein
MTAVLGVDIGLGGALALRRHDSWVIIDTPVTGDGKHREINGPALCSWLREQRPDFAFVEFASARPHQGTSSTFKFGSVYGATKMALAACGVPFSVVAARKWKAVVGIPAGADKEYSRRRALELYPEASRELMRKRDCGRSEAMLIAHYGVLSLTHYGPKLRGLL